jgi:UDP-glucose 4-epimerase
MLGQRNYQEEVSNDTEDETIVNDNEEKKPQISMEKKKPGFVQKQIEENKRLKEELEKYKSEEVPKVYQQDRGA